MKALAVARLGKAPALKSRYLSSVLGIRIVEPENLP